MSAVKPRVFRSKGAWILGWVWLVYGNSGWDVVCDYTTSLDALMQPVLDYANTLED